MKLLKKYIFTFLFLLAMSIVNNAFAAGPPGPPSGGGGGPPCWPPPCVPIDGGISFLLIAGVAYGGKKIYDVSKTEKAD
jgi:hypothetical protein